MRQAAKIYQPLIHKIDQAAWCRDDDICTTPEAVHLAFVTGAADYRRAGYALWRKLAAKSLGLVSKLARRRKHENFGSRFAFVIAEHLQYRQQKSGRFAGAGLGTSDNVSAL